MTQCSFEESIEQYHSDIKNELECLLNQRCVQYPFEEKLGQLNDSLFSYGLTEQLKWAPYEKLADPAYLHQLAQLIMHHEPRLNHCRISYLEDYGQQIALLIEGEVNYLNHLSMWQCVALCQPIQRRFSVQ